MKTIYLVDFENVLSAGLQGCDRLGIDDHIIIFYTTHADKLDLDLIAVIGEAKLSAIRAKAGHQSVDMLIASYLGNMLGKHSDEDVSYRIISRDTDYDSTVEFWSEREGADISRFADLKSAITMNRNLDETTDSEEVLCFEDIEPADNEESSPAKRSSLNACIMRALGGRGFAQYDIGFCASTAVHALGMSNFKQRIYREYISEFGMADGLKYYNLVKPCL